MYDRKCTVVSCSVSVGMKKSDGKPYEFFHFPKDVRRLKRWTRVVNPQFPDFVPKPHSLICERHFRQKDLLFNKPDSMDGPDPHGDNSLDEDPDPDFTQTTGFQTSSLPPRESAHSYALNSCDWTLLEDEGDLETSVKNRTCCASEIPVMRMRVKNMERKCDVLFLKLRCLLQLEQSNGAAASSWQHSKWMMQSINGAFGEDLPSQTKAVEDFEKMQMCALRAIEEQELARVSRHKQIRQQDADSCADYHQKDHEDIGIPNHSIVEPSTSSSHAYHHADDERTTVYRGERRGEIVFGDSTHEEEIIIVEEPRLAPDSLVLLHPSEERLLNQDEIRYFVARVILRLPSETVTKPRIRMQGPKWLQAVDDIDILAAMNDLRSKGLLVIDEMRRARNSNITVYVKARPESHVAYEELMGYYHLTNPPVVTGNES
ncbi:hypothetical protein AB6A40_009180 [Gnathostoma spinigerum]|uniref:THAP-type domain-containing protein n=1 Tax=Gnathostoma spinigerum TaxID=75299 RepID=A0ABD6ET28_9BILA